MPAHAQDSGSPSGPPTLTTADAAAMLGVGSDTLRRWTAAGRVRCWLSPGGHRRYWVEDIQRLLAAATTDPRQAS